MAVQTTQDLLVREMSEIYDAEQKIAQILPQMVEELRDGQVKSILYNHELETRGQIKNLEQCFQILGSQPQRVTAHVADGFRQGHEEFVGERPPQDMLKVFDLDTAAKVGYYEIGAYRSLVDKATLLGQPEVVRMLQENLWAEESMAQKAEDLGRQVEKDITERTGQPFTTRR